MTGDDTAAKVRQRQGRAVRERRRALEKTQVDLAAAVGRSQRQISSIEAGESDTPLEVRMAIAAALDTTHDALFGVDVVVPS